MMRRSIWTKIGIFGVGVASLVLGRVGLEFVTQPQSSTLLAADPPTPIPSPKLPEGPLGEAIRMGELLVEQTATHEWTKPYVGNALHCTSCHLDNGRDPKAGSFLGVAAAYPAYSPREKRVITLEDRVLNCFMRSCNGTRPPLGGRVSVAITAYLTWLSQSQPIAMNAKAPLGPNAVPKLTTPIDNLNLQAGKAGYAKHCARCHRADGAGDSENPPVWGARSYNDGAGLARVEKLAPWLKVAMPLGEPMLTDREAIDIAAYIHSQPRPKFRLSEHLPPADRLGEYNADPAAK
ncbi:c-type cytochrome [Tuwongella immobilis]|uniref:Cytochrome c domain-containing protein n=1 Tax=Tuwongella immobilis TaxID=692036 RepID=A0A6C2YS90_9BACT|nr:c-type cytochrome [Tuwongella immobilis]VIP03845.1 cytochrome c class i : Cytochrome c class I OS=Planctomyces brasiliensis (strain ATCC 49424 / DSM 5305 / JCM 21570 / NBRC 103401 / IFAM 1448) GN=Plabr_1503 PE=4 SV=1: Cytochrom_C [Tuwongella immobilis]VTS05057.1 cytochrome c class i : Cytochrome c class I OS=Planctomyces brasiliensis (strain ATCC 49424 / DSM 5305 / JCM 21570 / NBRC 103401 / IFAM 1448) GN=Plabr_1503 PE=4 SV=1: Cytochrom_C [Tuwongella immobilis]